MSQCRNPRTGKFTSCAAAFRGGRSGLRGLGQLGHNYPGEYESGANSLVANDIVLTLENDGAIYPARQRIEKKLHAAWKRKSYTHRDGIDEYAYWIRNNIRRTMGATRRATPAQIEDAANAMAHALEAEFPYMD